MAALASGEACPSSGGLTHRTIFSLKCCDAALIVHCNKIPNHNEVHTMVEETKVQAQAAADAPADVAKAVADTADAVAKESAKATRRERATVARRAKRREAAAAPKAQRRTSKTQRVAKPRRTTRKAARTAAAAPERIETVTNNFFNAFEGLQGAAPFQSLFADANGRAQDAVKRSQRVAEELAELTRSNVEAIVEFEPRCHRSCPFDRPGRGREQPRRSRAGGRRDPLARRSQVADRISSASGRFRPRLVRPSGR